MHPIETETMPSAEDTLLNRIDALRGLMPRAEALLAQVSDYIRAAEKTASDIGEDDRRLREERAQLQEEREEVAALRRQLIDARSEFEQGAQRQDEELESLRARLTAVCSTLADREAERDAASSLRTELDQARARVRELETKGSRERPEDVATPALARLRGLEAELTRAREERTRMLEILARPAAA
jgi:chromosome segregation ATPase